MLEIFFPIVDTFLNPIAMLFTGLFGGFISGFLGIGSGIIITPALMEFGISPLTAIATQLCHAIGTNLTSFLSYKRKSAVDYHLAGYMLFGGMLSIILEWFILHHFDNPRIIFNKFVCVYILILIVLGFVISFQGIDEWRHCGSKRHIKSVSMRRWMLYLPFHKIFIRSRTEMSILIPIFMGSLACLLLSSLGGGDNLFIAPTMTYLIGRTSQVVDGTTALVACVLTTITTLIYSANNYCCDIFLSLILLTGAAIGSRIGRRLACKIHRHYVCAISAVIVFLMAARQIFKLINHSFSEMVNTKLDLPKLTFLKIVKSSPIEYTLICILSVALIAFIYDRALQNFFERKSFIGGKSK
ncbi:MAG: sulfite exporter TauE/SafE family protein [Holosporales bacterium]|nr:sulfite exporter TauE/SafE family protein [Holosporales bacterium]